MTQPEPTPNSPPTPLPAPPQQPLPPVQSGPKRWLPLVLGTLVLLVIGATAGAVGYQSLKKEKVDSVNSSPEGIPTIEAELPLSAAQPSEVPPADSSSLPSPNLTEGFSGVDTTKLVPWPTISYPQNQHTLDSLLSLVPFLNQGVSKNSYGQLESSFYLAQGDRGTLQIEWIEEGGKRTLIDPLLEIVNDEIKIATQHPTELKLSSTTTVSLRELPHNKIIIFKDNQRFDFELFVKKSTSEGATVTYFGLRTQSDNFPVLDGYSLNPDETSHGYILFLADNLIFTLRENKTINTFERMIITAAPEPYTGDPRCLPGIPKGDCDLIHEFDESGQSNPAEAKRLHTYYNLGQFPASLFFRNQ